MPFPRPVPKKTPDKLNYGFITKLAGGIVIWSAAVTYVITTFEQFCPRLLRPYVHVDRDDPSYIARMARREENERFRRERLGGLFTQGGIGEGRAQAAVTERARDAAVSQGLGQFVRTPQFIRDLDSLASGQHGDAVLTRKPEEKRKDGDAV